jgi:gamma-glutamyltranspeptidase / glutathione hydrolase
MIARGAKADEVLNTKDIAEYRPKQRETVCGPYKAWKICSMAPPSSGGITMLQILGHLEHSGISMSDPMSVSAMHAFVESSRLAFADRGRYLADPDFAAIPQVEMLDPIYLSQRARLIDPQRVMGNPPPGDLPQKLALADDDSLDIPATTHLSIVDVEGNAVSMTSSVESAFGSRIGVGGFLLNNQLTDFSWSHERNGKPVANRMEPGKRPLSSMAPSFVFDAEGSLYAVIGSAGGPRIINYVARALSALLDAKLEPTAAVALPHVGPRPNATDVERGTAAESQASELERRGHVIAKSEITSGTHLIVREVIDGKNMWAGAVDPRREGFAAGE